METEIRAFNESTAFAVIAQNAEFAHGVAWVVAATAGPDGCDAICCSQFADVASWTLPHNSGRPTGNIWPLSSSVATNLTNENFMRAPEYTTCANGGANGGGLRSGLVKLALDG